MLTRLRKTLRAFRHDRRGNIAIMSAIAMPVILGSLGIGAEVASWHASKRTLQNAADSAAIAAATNGSETYINEAVAVTGRYGFHPGEDGVTVTAADEQPCPNGLNECYRVSITKVQPLLLAQVVGFGGDTQIGGVPAKRISATALARKSLAPREYCILALASSGDPQALRTNGAPSGNMTGCNVMSNSDAKCAGHDLDATFGDAHGINTGCGNKQNSNVPTVEDPYATRAANIPPNPCGSTYHHAPQRRTDPALPSANTLHGLLDRTTYKICGDAQALGPVLISQPNTQIIVYGGSLDLQEYTIQTMPGGSATIIFAGPDGLSGFKHIPMGRGGFDMEAPKEGPWKGIAMYQDPSLRSGVDIDEAGNTPTWDITGLVYMPHSSVRFSGAVNKSSNGAACFAMVVDNITINGTGSILDAGGCAAAGLVLPSTPMPGRGELVS